MRDYISDIDTRLSDIRAEILADINFMLTVKKLFTFKDKHLFQLTGNKFEIDSLYKQNDDEPGVIQAEVSGIDSKGNRDIVPLNELDTDTLLRIADEMCNQYDKL